ncbi:MAG: hypothetical protein M3176_19105 [Chloroflexota bacterium]|nr:hypothetical protein [Chloroflexota bacterium]
MLRGIVRGMVAGAIGALTLNVVTYADMAMRGRPSSDAPAKLADILAKKAGIDLSGGKRGDDANEQIRNRQSGLGALLGYATGLGIGSIYGGLRASADQTSKPIASLTLGLVAIATSDVPLTVYGLTEPTKWTRAEWIADLVPHLAYGVMTAAVCDALTPDRP